MRTAAVLVVCGLLFAGCAAPVQTYYGQPAADAAVLRESDNVHCGKVNAFVVGSARGFFDGPNAPREYAVRPGTVSLLVMYARNDTFSKIDTNPKAVEFLAEAGHSYRFESLVPLRLGFTQIGDAEWDVRVIDRADGRVVAETRDRPSAATRPAA